MRILAEITFLQIADNYHILDIDTDLQPVTTVA